jgi:hypothetical protein
MRSWMSATNSLASVVMIAKVRIHSPEAGSFQFSQMPPMPNGLSSFMAQLHPGAVGRPANSTGRYLQVLTANGGDHVLRCQPPPGDLLRIEPDAHDIIAGAPELDAADALDLRELVLDVEEILKFDSEANLQTWLNSTERNNLLEQAAAFTDEYHIRIVRMGFDQWFEVGVAGASSPPAWKQNTIVLLILAERGAKHVNINLLRYFSEPATLDSKAKTFLQRGMALAMEWATQGLVVPHVSQTIDSTVEAINAGLQSLKAGRGILGKVAVIVDRNLHAGK